MKMLNNDVKKITEIKQYLLDPPVSFKLYEYALMYVKDAIAVLSSYPDATETITHLQNLLQQLENKNIDQKELPKLLKETGIKLSRLTNK